MQLGRPDAAPLTAFYQGTGFTPSKYLLSEQGKVNMLMASGSGYRFMRVHCMLDLIDIQRDMQSRDAVGASLDDGTAAAGTLLRDSGLYLYNWTLIDAALDVLVGVRLTPFINLDGNPTGTLHDLFMQHDFLFPPKLGQYF